jgi:hypothetical protein
VCSETSAFLRDIRAEVRSSLLNARSPYRGASSPLAHIIPEHNRLVESFMRPGQHYSLPSLKVGLAPLNEGLDTLFYILALHNRLQIGQKLLYRSLFTLGNG